MDNYSCYIQMLRKNLKRRLPAMRYEHSLSVSFTCMALAMRYGTDLNQAEVAGHFMTVENASATILF